MRGLYRAFHRHGGAVLTLGVAGGGLYTLANKFGDISDVFPVVQARESVGGGKAPSFVAGGGGGGGGGPSLRARDTFAQRGAEFPPPATWDFNWDKRQPEAVVKPPPPTSPNLQNTPAYQQQLEDYREKLAKATPSAVRVLILVRHGQYNLSGSQDSERYLTQMGEDQADLTGKRLVEIFKYYNNNQKKYDLSMIMSSMTRATQTAQIIAKHFGEDEKPDSCHLIREGAPCEPVPSASSIWDPEPHLFFEEGARIEAGFRKYFHRADPSQKDNSVQVLVCHGNVIRYFLCRALQLPPQAWLRFSLPNGSFTTITIQPTGRVSISGIGEVGHFPTDKLTFN